jgi:hypothetical protein
VAGRESENEHLWYHGTEDSGLTEFKSLKKAQTGDNGSDMGEGTYLTRDRSWAEEHAFRGGNGPSSDVPHPDSWEREEWEDSAHNGRILAVQFQPKNPARFDYSKGAPREYEQAEAARKAGHDAIMSDNVAVSFKPHKNAKIVKSMAYQDLHHWGHTPERVAQEADEEQSWR